MAELNPPPHRQRDGIRPVDHEDFSTARSRTSVETRSCFQQASGRNFVDQNDDAEEAAPRVDAAHHLVEGPDDQTAGGDHLGHCRYGTVRIHEPEDRRRDEKDAEREVWCLSNGRSRLAVAETPEQKSSHHRACPIQIPISRSSRHASGILLYVLLDGFDLGVGILSGMTLLLLCFGTVSGGP
jgi:hypothetical protein